MPHHHRCSSRPHLVWSLALALAGCDSSPESPVAPSAPVTDPTRPGYHTLSGTVLEAFGGTFRPAARTRTLFFWVEQRTERGSSASVMPVNTDANGRYTASVPDSRVSVSAWSRAELQPCLINAEVRTDTLLDVQVVPIAEAQSVAARQLQSEGPIVSGQVYERTPAGNRPVADADVIVDISVDVYHAFTKTDVVGRFFLCRISAPIRIDVGMTGYQWESRFLRDASTDLEIELRRN
jgi:hypothetical protein